MLKVLILSHMFPREHHKVGGIFVMEQVKALRRLGIDARVLSGDPFWITKFKPKGLIGYTRAWRYAQLNGKWIDCDEVPVIFFPYMAGGLFRPWVHAWTYDLGLRSVLSRLRNEFAYDLVHAHTSYLDGTAGLTAAKLGEVPLVITEHTGPFSLLTNHLLKRFMTKRAVKTADYVIAVSDSLRSDMMKQLNIPNGHIEVLPNGYDGHNFQQMERKQRGNGIRALWVGHFVSVKRVDRLIEAFSIVANEFPQLTISLMGNGEGLDEARRDITQRGLSERIVFLDKADRRGVADAMRMHDFLVVSSEVETFSLVTIEAFATGLPVLSTRCGGPEGLITDRSLGRLVPNNVDGLASGLTEMCVNVDHFDSAAIAAYAQERYSLDGVARELTSIYGKLTSTLHHQASLIA